MFISYIYSVVCGGQIGHLMALGRAMTLNAPLISQWRFVEKIFCLTIF